jgi:hypothetical protein
MAFPLDFFKDDAGGGYISEFRALLRKARSNLSWFQSLHTAYGFMIELATYLDIEEFCCKIQEWQVFNCNTSGRCIPVYRVDLDQYVFIFAIYKRLDGVFAVFALWCGEQGEVDVIESGDGDLWLNDGDLWLNVVCKRLELAMELSQL